jgi:hypothetical protein
VIGKAEHLIKGENPRFVVTSLSADKLDGRVLYEDLYCARSDMENRIKEQQLALFADRTSTREMRSNQLRHFSSFTYVLMQTLRRGGAGRHFHGQGTVRHHSTEAAQGRRAHTAHCAPGPDRLLRGLPLRRAVPENPAQAAAYPIAL